MRDPDREPVEGLEISVVSGVLEISGPAQAAGPRNLVVELTLTLSQPLQIVGSELDIVRTHDQAMAERASEPSLDSDAPPVDQSAPAPAGGRPLPTRLDVVRSSVDLRGSGGAAIIATDSRVVLVDTSGRLELAATGGTIDLSSHRGDVTIEGTDASVTITGMSGRLDAHARAGRLSLNDMTGQATVRLESSGIDIGGHQGSLTITAELSDVEIRAATLQATTRLFQLAAALPDVARLRIGVFRSDHA